MAWEDAEERLEKTERHVSKSLSSELLMIVPTVPRRCQGSLINIFLSEAPGEKGIPGTQGLEGMKGRSVSGTVGRPGEDGTDGNLGERGDAGTAGTDGTYVSTDVH